MNGWVDGWMDGRMDGWMDGVEIVKIPCLFLGYQFPKQSKSKLRGLVVSTFTFMDKLPHALAERRGHK